MFATLLESDEFDVRYAALLQDDRRQDKGSEGDGDQGLEG